MGFLVSRSTPPRWGVAIREGHVVSGGVVRDREVDGRSKTTRRPTAWLAPHD